MPTQVIMPQLGESIVEGTVVKWLKAQGEKIASLESILEVETDKVVTEIPSPAEGVLLAMLVQEGTTVKVGTVIGWIGQPGEIIPLVGDQKSDTVMAKDSVSIANSDNKRGMADYSNVNQEVGFVSPVAAKIAHENKIDLHQVKGTGQGGRITKRDLLQFLEQMPKSGTAIWETPADGDLFRPSELVSEQAPSISSAPVKESQQNQTDDIIIPHTAIRKLIAERMVFSKTAAPHVTTVMEADLGQVMAHREANQAAFLQGGARLTYTAYFVSATITALKVFPKMNSSWEETGIRVHRIINIGLATSLGEEGLIVPVLRNADGLSLLGIARSVNDLADRARSHKLQVDEVKDGTFTITNHGVFGSLFATPIINQPQSAILGIGAIQKRTVVINDAIAIHPMTYLSLTFDHRILDGAAADLFLAKLVDVLEKWG